MPTINATPGAVDANSYETLIEFVAYLTTRLPVPTAAIAATDATREKALIVSTRALNRILTRFKRLEILQSKGKMEKFYVVRPYWTGSPTSTTQLLPWPRDGMFDRNGNAIVNTVIPQDLKDAESEMAILAISGDVTATNAVAAQGITDVKAGPIEIAFKEYIQNRVLPEAVYLALVPSWLTDEKYENIPQAKFSTLGIRSA